ncbi:MAG: cupin domain-containing protein [Ignavibacteriota bacterium]
MFLAGIWACCCRCWRRRADRRKKRRCADDRVEGIRQRSGSVQGRREKKGRQFFLAATHAGFKIECHETVLGPGLETHPPHKHLHEEIMIVVAGTVEANLDGVKQTVPPGSVVVFGSNQTHNARNAGTTPSRYYIVELRGTEA